MAKSTPISHIRETLCRPDDTFWRMFEALGNCVRYRMVKALLHYRNLTVTDLSQICLVSVPAASQQLKLLARLGIVVRRQDGRSVHYELERTNRYLKKIVQVIDEHLDEALAPLIPNAR